ncbi:DUF1015 domain-containing protein [candidate division WOR-3 bacterium]|nr:DUF1015 domain-containing protein [candidate division WOR-3 bacterium]
MADIRPFPGIRYNPAKAPNLDRVITQPYDKISPKMQAAYYEQDPLSFVRLILPKGDSPYVDSDRTCRDWLGSGTLVRDPRPAIYVLHEEFETGGRRLTRRGMVAAVRVDEFEKGAVLPHEFTLSRAKADRLNMLRATGRDYEQIFMLYSDPEGRVDSALAPSGPPDLQATDEYGVVHRMWAVTDPAKLAEVHRLMADKVLLIADGHHRYETALTYRQEKERAGALPADAAVRFKTSAFVNIADPGLLILPTHRLLHSLPGLKVDDVLAKLKPYFAVTPVPAPGGSAELERNREGNACLLYAGKARCWLLRLNSPAAVVRFFPPERSADYRGLDVSVLHSVLIEGMLGVNREDIEKHVRYERYWDEALKRVDSGENQLALLMNPTRADQVRTLAEKGERMPQKSTDFYPKLISGMVFMDVADEQVL